MNTTKIHGEINEAVRLDTLSVGDWYKDKDDSEPIGVSSWPYPVKITPWGSVGYDGEESKPDPTHLLVHPLTRETLPDGTHRWWYVGSKRAIGELPVGTVFRYIPEDGGVTPPNIDITVTGPEVDGLIPVEPVPDWYKTASCTPDFLVRVIRYPDAPAKGEAKADGQTEFGRIITVEHILREHDKRLAALESARTPKPDTKPTLSELVALASSPPSNSAPRRRCGVSEYTQAWCTGLGYYDSDGIIRDPSGSDMDIGDVVRQLNFLSSECVAQADELTRLTALAAEREQEIGRLRADLRHAHIMDWTPSIIDRLNEMVRENLDDLHEINKGPEACDLIRLIHGQYNGYKQAALAARDTKKDGGK